MQNNVRQELKYLLNYNQYLKCKESVAVLMEIDKHAQQERSYPVLSYYYDTPNLDFFRQKEASELKHEKVRLRTYNTNFNLQSRFFIENKVKVGDSVHKLRHELNLDSDDISWKSIANDTFKNKYYSLAPILKVLYTREAYNYHMQSLRVNFDFNISAQKICKNNQKIYHLLPNEVLMEVKFAGNSPSNILNLLFRNMDITNTSFSKYFEACKLILK